MQSYHSSTVCLAHSCSQAQRATTATHLNSGRGAPPLLHAQQSIRVMQLGRRRGHQSCLPCAQAPRATSCRMYGPCGCSLTACTIMELVSQEFTPQCPANSLKKPCHFLSAGSRAALPPQLEVLPSTSYAVWCSDGAKSSKWQRTPDHPLSQSHVALPHTPFSEQSRSDWHELLSLFGGELTPLKVSSSSLLIELWSSNSTVSVGHSK